MRFGGASASPDAGFYFFHSTSKIPISQVSMRRPEQGALPRCTQERLAGGFSHAQVPGHCHMPRRVKVAGAPPCWRGVS